MASTKKVKLKADSDGGLKTVEVKSSVPADISSELENRLLEAWFNFRTSLGDFSNKMEDCVVDLGFESNHDIKTYYTYSTDEPIFITDVEVTNSNKVAFVTPYGTKTKSFQYMEAELIQCKLGEEQKDLQSFLEEIFAKSFENVPEVGSVLILERKYLAVYPHLREVFNDVEAAICKKKLDVERIEKFSSLDDYGLF